MSFDVIFARAVAAELCGELRGARVEKVYQPSKEELVLGVRAGRESKKLMISASPSSARVCLTEAKYENPPVPPMLCMLLRKHLSGAQIADISTVGFERAIDVTLDCFDELGFPCRRHLIAEIMGKYSNVIFTDDENGTAGKILGVMHAVDFSTSRLRQVLSGMTYSPPPAQDKLCPLDEDACGFLTKFDNYPPEKDTERFFIDTYSGFSPVVAREITYRAGAEGKPARFADVDRLYLEFSRVMQSVRDGRLSPNIVCDGDRPVEFSYLPVTHFGTNAEMTDFSSLLERFYGEKAESEALKNRIGATEAVVSSAQKRLIKKVTVLESELAECAETDKFRLWGDLITSALYKLSGKARYADVENYYADPVETVRVPLDEKLTPSQNAARYYKKYNKLKTTKTVATEQLEKTHSELEYLSSVQTSLSLCESGDDVREIRDELTRTGYIRSQQKNAPRKPKKNEPMYFILTSGREIICGKNNTQNDELTLRTADKWDFWFHVKGGAGSHVIMKCAQGEDPDARDFTEAAQAAAYYSDERDSDNVAVDYTRVKFVKKPQGAAPGRVIYTDYYTAYVRPAIDIKRK